VQRYANEMEALRVNDEKYADQIEPLREEIEFKAFLFFICDLFVDYTPPVFDEKSISDKR
jgi:hypothetical protein